MPMMSLKSQSFVLKRSLRVDAANYFRRRPTDIKTVLMWDSRGSVGDWRKTNYFRYLGSRDYRTKVKKSVATSIYLYQSDDSGIPYLLHPNNSVAQYFIRYDACENNKYFTYNLLPLVDMQISRIVSSKCYGSYSLGIVECKNGEDSFRVRYIRSTRLSDWVII